MNTNLKNISAEEYQTFVDNASRQTTFLQSQSYGELRASQGETIHYLGLFDGDNCIATALVQEIKTKLKTFCHIPHGPVWNNLPTDDLLKSFLEAYKDFGKSLKVDFVRISPFCDLEEKHNFKAAGFRDAAIHMVNPEKTWTLDITKNEESLLADMKKSTRYEVRKGLKPEVNFEVKKGNTKEDLDIFWELHLETVARQGFVPFSRKSTEKELEAFGANCQIISILHEKKPLASGVFLFNKNQGYYHQGASISSKLPAAHAYIWQAILEAKSRDCKHFNFWGVCDENNSKHPWFGLSKFKRGFGGSETDYLHVQDAPLSTKYWLTFGIEKYRRWKRGY